ncbi:VTT domain-containing protein [Lysinibacillus sp. KU-BSD001]|uniref:VTT domain-containing protein n=1 Tax=Lysinibacillus sp. KU-BSD001 TaxID=3141328 RepID=UPI0036E25B76
MHTFLLEMRQIDVAIHHFLEDYGHLVYILLFFIIYCKTAFVVLTFLPGDATVFVSGALAALGELNLWFLVVILFAATVLGDTQNYCIGKIGQRVTGSWRVIPKTTLQSAKDFFKNYGHRAILFSRFIPLMRTTIPFVTGYTNYPLYPFLAYNSMGGGIWVVLWLGAGLLLGQIPIVEQNMALSLPIISCIPFLPPIIFYIVRLLKNNKIKRIGGV